jgi:hypothetical protein
MLTRIFAKVSDGDSAASDHNLVGCPLVVSSEERLRRV